MRLEDVVRWLEVFADDSVTICARKPWTADSDTELVKTDERGGIPQSVKAQGFAYFLELFTAREIMEPYVETQARTLKEKLAFLIYYAEHDSFPEES